ncbi:uncharacterized protein MKK02DRAFT_29909 [Dioszegia hungarica]|uniref:Uncharacterized protein n=1 Tax=Dioszegia hungarica TaxID=4972 RepID=A0AA38LSQ6_9TREE|nr:uncharacterized protein MKK02DRAFT_29909 [Dioszegia hungarica]KAI9632909.1 hypothetical protein MKK02DRAFT_29909 [Dioszegia hungarica]
MFSDDWARGPGKVPRRHWNETIASAKAAFWEYSARLQRLRSGQDPLVHDPDQATRDRGLSSKSAYPCTDTLGIRRALQAFIKTALHREMGTLFNKLTQDMHGEVPRGLLRPKISDSTRLDWRQRQDLRRTGMLNSDSLSCLLPDPPTFQLILQTIDKSLPTYDAVQSEPVQRVVLAAANTPNDPPPPYSEASAAPPQQQSTRQHQQETSSGSDGDDNEQWFDSMEGMSGQDAEGRVYGFGRMRAFVTCVRYWRLASVLASEPQKLPCFMARPSPEWSAPPGTYHYFGFQWDAGGAPISRCVAREVPCGLWLWWMHAGPAARICSQRDTFREGHVLMRNEVFGLGAKIALSVGSCAPCFHLAVALDRGRLLGQISPLLGLSAVSASLHDRHGVPSLLRGSEPSFSGTEYAPPRVVVIQERLAHSRTPHPSFRGSRPT